LYVRHDLTLDQWILVNKPSSIKIKSILGYLGASPNNPEGLSMVIETADSINTFAFTPDFIQWNYDASVPIPADFPLTDFSSYSYQLMYLQRIAVFGGTSSSGGKTVQNAVWATDNGLYWAKLTGGVNVFPPLKGANVIYYNSELWLMNGLSGNDYNKNIYSSKDWGVTWQIRPDKCNLPDNYQGRYGASVVVDGENKHFYIIGGKDNQNVVLSDVWKGFLNKAEFAH
jgi:hypothetical protein